LIVDKENSGVLKNEKKIFVLVFTINISTIFLVGCTAYKNTVRGIFRSIGAITKQDLQEANMFVKIFPAYLNIDKRFVSVEPGTTVTHLIIKGYFTNQQKR